MNGWLVFSAELMITCKVGLVSDSVIREKCSGISPWTSQLKESATTANALTIARSNSGGGGGI